MPTLLLTPDSDGYQVQDPTEVIAVRLKGGASRYRADILNAVSLVTVKFTLDADDYQYWRSFYRTTIKKGSIPFQMGLIMDESSITNHTVFIVPGTLSLSQQQGQMYVIGFQVEAIPLAANVNHDDLMVYLRGVYGDFVWEAFDSLATLVNVTLPDNLT